MHSQKPVTSPLRQQARSKRAAQAVVRCRGFQCMAYQDKDGAWRSVADDQPLEVLEVIMRF